MYAGVKHAASGPERIAPAATRGANLSGVNPPRGVARAATFVLLVLLGASCLPEPTRPSPSPSPSPTAARPRFELSTYMYALQVKGKVRVAIRDGAGALSTRTQARYDGFEADLAREIAKAIWGTNDDPDTHIEWVPVDDATRASALTGGQADVAIAGIAITDQTSGQLDLSDPYLLTGQRLLVKRDNDQIKELSDVASGEQTVCAVRNSVWRNELARVTNNGAKILELDTLEFCTQALASGAADAVTHDELVLFGLAAKDPGLKVVAKRFAEKGLGLAVKKNANGDRQGFVPFLSGVLAKIVADRTWAKLYEKYLQPLTGETRQAPTG